MSENGAARSIEMALFERFGETFTVNPELSGLEEIIKIVAHRSHRQYLPRPITSELLRTLCACALSAPSKSDLQQCDIIVISDTTIRKSIASRIPDMPWIEEAPAFLVFAANGGRLQTISKLRGKPFPNNHLDLLFNATVDAALVLATFIRAAEAVGLGCCPISAIRDHCQTVSNLLQLPELVIPVAGVCVGWPAQRGEINPRLSLRTTVVENNYLPRDLAGEVEAYDRRRAKLRAYNRQRNVDRWGTTSVYGWSEDKARQYAEPMRSDFGSFVRRKGFCLE